MTYNSNTFLLSFRTKGKPFFLSYDNQGSKTGEKKFEDLSAMNRSTFNTSMPSANKIPSTIFPLGTTGFVKYSAESNLKMGMMVMGFGGSKVKVSFSLKGYSNSLKETFNFNFDGTEENIAGVVNFSNEKLIGITVTRQGDTKSGGVETSFLVIDATNGRMVFEKNISEGEEYLNIINAVYNEKENSFLLAGEIFKKGKRFENAKSLGLFFTILDAKGHQATLKELTYEKDLAKIKSLQGEEKGGIYFHDFFVNGGNWIGVAERYSYSGSKVESKEIIVMQFNNKFELNSTKIFAKEGKESKTSGPASSRAVQELSVLGAFDFNFIERGDEDLSYTIVYGEQIKEKNKVLENKMTIGAIYFNGNDFTVKKTPISTEGTSIFISPADQGNVVTWEYYKKEKLLKSNTVHIN